LRVRWLEHLEKLLMRTALLIDKSQEIRGPSLSELRLLASTQFDLQIILTRRVTAVLHRR